MISTRQVTTAVEGLARAYEDLCETVRNGSPELQELVSMRERVKNHDKTVRELHKCYNDIRLLQMALEMAAIDAYYRLTDEQQARLEQTPGKEPWHALTLRWREQAADRIEQEDSE